MLLRGLKDVSPKFLVKIEVNKNVCECQTKRATKGSDMKNVLFVCLWVFAIALTTSVWVLYGQFSNLDWCFLKLTFRLNHFDNKYFISGKLKMFYEITGIYLNLFLINFFSVPFSLFLLLLLSFISVCSTSLFLSRIYIYIYIYQLIHTNIQIRFHLFYD